MAKGVKKIKWTGVGRVVNSLSIPNKKVVMVANQDVFFEVDSWFEDTIEEQKKKNLTWILQDKKNKTIISEGNAPGKQALCDQYSCKIMRPI
jgi:hypothetical protein